MNILFITTKCPLPTNDGHSLRSFNLLKQVATVHDVHLLSFVKYQHEFDYLEDLEKICSSVQLFNVPENTSKIALATTIFLSFVGRKPFVVIKYDTKQMRKAIRSTTADVPIDLIHFDMLPLAVYLDEVTGERTVLDEHNVESMLLKRRVQTETRLISKWFFQKQQVLLEQFEKFVCRDMDSIVTCSDEDRHVLHGFAPNTPVTVVPNGVDMQFFSRDPEVSREVGSMIFVGGLNWFPNLDALQWFDRKILPLILKDCPNAHLHIIGQKGDDIFWKHSDSITSHGFVEDILPYMSKASVFVVPLRIGGGTRLKILNAMAMEIPVVSTTIGAEGLGAVSGENIILAEQEQEFAKAVIKLFDQSEYRKEIAINGRKLIEEKYRWKKIGQKLLKVYSQD